MSESSTPRTDRAEANWGKPGASMVEHARQLEREHAELVAALERYMAAYPAFRMKPIGAEGSPARIEQENLMALEETARAALAKARA